MRKEIRRAVKRSVRKGFKIFSITVLASSVAFWAPWAVCHVCASEAMGFSTCLLSDEDGNLLTDENGKFIEIFDENNNPLVYNEDVMNYLKKENDGEGSVNVTAKKVEFFLIDGKLYSDVEGNNLITDLSTIIPAVIKYGKLSDGYELGNENSGLRIDPVSMGDGQVYVARSYGDDINLPSFTVTDDGQVQMLERGTISDGERSASFVYDSNNFYDENMCVLDHLDGLAPDSSEDAPMYTGYYAKNGDERRQIVDIDGSIMVSAGEYADMLGAGADINTEYCNVLKFSGTDADSLTVYSDMEDGSLYQDYQRTESFENIGGAILSQLAYDEETNDERGHFAGYYKANPDDEEAPMIQIIDEGGNLLADNVGVLSGNEEYAARFYHKLTMVGGDSEGELYYSDGKWYKDTALLEETSGIGDVIGDMPADEENEVYSEEKEMNGTQTRYFIGYYFETGFGADEDEEVQEQEMLLSDYDEENFDPNEVQINKVKFSDRGGNIVFDGSVSIDGDVVIYQNFYTVTVWDDGEVEIEDDADEPEDEEKKTDEETEEMTEETEEDAENQSDEDGENSDSGDENNNSDENQDNADESGDDGESDQNNDSDNNDAENGDADSGESDGGDSGESSDGSDQQESQDDAGDQQESQDDAGDQQESQDGSGDQQESQDGSEGQQESQDGSGDQQESQDGAGDQQESQDNSGDQQGAQDNAGDQQGSQDGNTDESSDASGSDDDQNAIEETATPATNDSYTGEGPEKKEDDDDNDGNADIGAALPEDHENEDGE